MNQAPSKGLTQTGLSRSRLRVSLDSFQAIVGFSGGVVVPLPSDVVVHPQPVLGAKADRTEHAIRKMAQMAQLLVIRDGVWIFFDRVDLVEWMRKRTCAGR